MFQCVQVIYPFFPYEIDVWCISMAWCKTKIVFPETTLGRRIISILASFMFWYTRKRLETKIIFFWKKCLVETSFSSPFSVIHPSQFYLCAMAPWCYVVVVVHLRLDLHIFPSELGPRTMDHLWWHCHCRAFTFQWLYSFHVAATCASCMYEKGWNQPSWVDLASFYNETYLISCPSPSLSRPTTDQLVERSHLNTALLVSCWIYIVYVWKESVPIGHLTAEPTNGSGAIMIWLHYSEQFITLFICPIYAGTVHTVARSGHSVFSGQFFRVFF